MIRLCFVLATLIVTSAVLVACPAPAPTSDDQEDVAASGGETEAASPILEVDEETPLCAVFPTLDGQRYNSRGSENGDVLASSLDLSHGEVVFGTIVEEIGRSPDSEVAAVSDIPTTDDEVVALLVVDNFRKPSTGDVMLPDIALYNEGFAIVGVDIGDFRVEQVHQTIQDTINAFLADTGVRRFVVNMSFALIPCNDEFQETLAEYQDGTNTAFADLHMSLSALLGITYGEGHSKAVEWTTSSDFSRFVKCLSGYAPIEGNACDQVAFPQNANVILVGAAGNDGYPFAFAPALWAHVVSASASDATGVQANYSNTGEVMMAGTTVHSHDGVDVVGTSFAAPRLALRQADYLRMITNSNQGIECAGAAGIRASPPLGYIPEAGDWDSGLDTDLTLDIARAQYCSP